MTHEEAIQIVTRASRNVHEFHELTVIQALCVVMMNGGLLRARPEAITLNVLAVAPVEEDVA